MNFQNLLSWSTMASFDCLEGRPLQTGPISNSSKTSSKEWQSSASMGYELQRWEFHLHLRHALLPLCPQM